MKTGVGLHMTKVCNPQLGSFSFNTEENVCVFYRNSFFFISFGHKFLKKKIIYPLFLFGMGERKIFLIDLCSFFCCLFASLGDLKVDFFFEG